MDDDTEETRRKDSPLMDLDDECDEPQLAFGPAALGLHRVGTVLPPKPQPQQPIQVLNARGMPARIRKKNKLFFDDDIVNDRPLRNSPGRKLMKTPTSASSSSSPVKTPCKILKKRKGVVSKYMRPKTERKSIGDGDKINTNSAEDDDDSDDEMHTPIGKKHSTGGGGAASTVDSSIKKDYSPTLAVASTSAPATPGTISSTSTTPSSLSVAERKIGQKIGMRLRNLLKLPKAHKWVSFEWFYSFIDKPLFDGENDFQICLKESFPQLRTRQLTRVEWSKIRRMMGKPRRCSQNFFDEERTELERRRQKIRLLQSRKSADPSYVKDLPTEIPLQLPVGTKVTARLRQPQDGLFTGTVAAIDTLASSYRIAFERPGLGSHSIPDYEVLSNDYVETISVHSLTQDLRPTRIMNNHGPSSSSSYQYYNSTVKKPSGLLSSNKNDPLIGSEVYQMNKFKNLLLPKEAIGGFPLKLLELIIRTKKTLAAKEMKLLRIKHMNTEAEMLKSYNEPFPDDFQQRYASIIIGMEKLNRDMQDYLKQIQSFTRDLTKEPQVAAMLTPSYLREKCREMGAESVDKNNQSIKDESMLQLIKDLAMIMWVASNLSGDGNNGHVLKVLDGCLHEAKNRLNPENIDVFQKHVQVHMRHIEIGLVQQQLAINNSNNTSNTNIFPSSSTEILEQS